MTKPSYYEFFCGGGMVRSGLGPGWTCLFANDIDVKKAKAYVENWGATALCRGDIHDIDASIVPGRADLAWASFPCQDLSLAGPGAGLEGSRSGAFWGFHALMKNLGEQGRAPPIIVLENVIGALTSKGGRDFVAICRAVQALGYRFGALTIDAADFVPQSRPRLFVVALRCNAQPAPGLVGLSAEPSFASTALRRAQARLPGDIAADWLWWRPGPPSRRNQALRDLLDEAPLDAPWRSQDDTDALLAILSRASRVHLEAARAAGAFAVGATYRRMRPDGAGGRRMQAEARFDGLAGCLRTPGGGSSRQFLIIADKGRVRSRLVSAREAARLMGLPEEYKLPDRASDAHHLLGDGVAAPVARFLAERLLEPLVAGAVNSSLEAAE
jgi:DNA (cytosine-5)-methyltransferase 1